MCAHTNPQPLEHANRLLLPLPYLSPQARVDAAYADQARWTRMSIMATAGSGKFSTDRTISEYAKDIWEVKACKVPHNE